MAKYEYSELFISVEGEGPYTGHPTVYIRFSRCNFTCKLFNNPDGLDDGCGYAPLEVDPKDITSLDDLQPIEIGCDSQYAVNPTFSHIWHKADERELAKATVDVISHKSWSHPKTHASVILSLTGGEPTLRAKFIPTLLAQPEFNDLSVILIETNCAVPLKQSFIDELNKWTNANSLRRIVWSNSPKLSASGEPWEKAIRPENAVMQRGVDYCEQYFKFVCGPNERDFDEVAKAMEEYWAGGVPRENNVYIMPMACTEEQQENIAAQVADMCIERGYIYCHRVHNSVYNNAIGK